MMGISNTNKKLQFTYYPNSPALSTTQPDIWSQDKNNFIAAVQGNITSAPKQFWWAKFIPQFITPLIAKYPTSNSQIITNNVITLNNFIKDYKNLEQINLLKIDCEGEEINVLHGINDSNWKIINNVIVEVNDVENNLEKAKTILLNNGLKMFQIQKEKGFEKTKLTNIYIARH